MPIKYTPASSGGNADTATALATARAINGVNFDGSAPVTVTAAAGTLSGDTLKATVVTSSLTTVGTIGTGTWNGTAIASSYIAADAITGAKIADDAIDSEHYTNGSIDNAHLAADAVTGAKIADDAINSEHYTDASVDFAHIQNVAANSILGRNANSSGVLSEVALTTTQILIGDGTGFTAAALSGQATMTNAGVVTVNSATLSDASSINISTPLLTGADHTTTGITAQMLAGGAIAAFKLVCIHSTTQEVVEADASVIATARAIGIAPAAISDTATGTVLLHGFVRDDTWTWTTGGVLYLSETAGAMTHTAPTTSGAFVQAVGIALSPDVVYINPSLDVIEHA